MQVEVIQDVLLNSIELFTNLSAMQTAIYCKQRLTLLVNQKSTSRTRSLRFSITQPFRFTHVTCWRFTVKSIGILRLLICK